MSTADWAAVGSGGSVLLVLVLVVLVRDVRAGRRARRLMLGLLGTAAATCVVGAIVTAVGRDPLAYRVLIAGTLLLGPLALTLYPTGRAVPELGWLTAVPVVTLGGLSLAYPEQYAPFVAPVGDYLVLVLLLWWRYLRSDEDSDERRALVWLFLGWGSASLAIVLMEFAVGGWGAVVPVTAAVLVAAVCTGYGLLAPSAHDVRRLVVESVVHLVALVVVIAAWVTAVAATELAVGGPLPPGEQGLLVAVLALGFGPLVVVLRGVVDQLFFGDRRPPLAAVSEIGSRLGEGPARALTSLRTSLALPYAAIVDGGGEVVATSGTPATRVVTVPLRSDDPGSGELRVGLRVGEAVLSGRDRQVLSVVGPPIAQLLHAQRLGAELEESRAQAIHAVEEERRRIRRDLHDGLGPRLTGVAYTADAARNTLGRGDADESAVLLASVRAEAGEAIAEVRRLVEGLRPPVLDQVGLVEALRQHAGTVRGRGGDPISVELDVEEPFGPLGAAVEVAAYRIAVEALTNAARHSGGTRCVVRLRRDGTAVTVEVTDDGHRQDGWTPGTGLTSMRERAELLGGTFDAGAGRVRVTLPA